MEQNARDMLSSQIFELFDTGEEAVQFLNENGLEGNQYLLQNLEALCATIAGAVEQLSPEIELKNKLKEIGLNAPLTVSRISRTLDEGKPESAYMQYVCSFVPLFCFWRRYLEFFLLHAATDDTLKSWYDEERARIRQIRETPKQDESREYCYDFSIVVLFYGNQSMTKECVDAIERYTKGHSYELITFDNGSDPETTAWCESLPHEKKIFYPHNMGSSAAANLILTMAPYYMEGKYLLYVSNDVIVTPRYDEILYQCMESDPRIALASPVYNSSTNLQMISVPYSKNDLKAMISFAEGYNHCDPRKWSDRARILQNLGCYRPQALRQMELALDPLFCYDMFADDDHSLALRRMGYRQILCRDVFVHHYGAATLKTAQFQGMDLGRAQFFKKHGIDAWGSLGTDLYGTLDRLTVSTSGAMRILALNPLFGESVLALCNRLKECGCNHVTVDALTEDARYLDDMEVLFHQSGTLEEAEQILDGQYDIALVGSSLGECIDLRAVLHVGASHLKSGGLLITQHENFFSISNLKSALTGRLPADSATFLHDPAKKLGLRVITDEALEEFLNQEGMRIAKAVPLEDDVGKPAADKVLAVLGIKQQKETELQLMSSGTFNVWRKRS